MSVWFGFSDAWQRADTRWLYSSPCSAHQTASDHPWSACTQRADDQRITLRSSFWSDPWAKKSATFRNFPCTADQSAGCVGVLLCSEQEAVSASIDFGDNLLGTDWVCGYSQLGYLVTWQILTVTRSVERWCDIAILTVTTGNTQNMAHPLEPLGTNVEERSASVIIFQNLFSYSQTVMQGSNLAT